MRKWIQLKGLFFREVSRYFHVPLQTLGTPIVNTFLYLLIFGVGLRNSIQGPDELPYLAFLLPGLIAMSTIKNAFDNATSAIIGPKYVNELQDLRIVPLAPYQISLSKSFASLSRGLLVGLITYLIGEGFYLIWEQSFLHITFPFLLFYFLLIGGLSFGFLGIAFGMWSKTFEQVSAVSTLVILPLIYLGGVFFTLDNLNPIWKKISLFNPLFYIINGVRYGMLGITDVSINQCGLITFAFFVLSSICAHFSLKKGSNYLR